MDKYHNKQPVFKVWSNKLQGQLGRKDRSQRNRWYLDGGSGSKRYIVL